MSDGRGFLAPAVFLEGYCSAVGSRVTMEMIPGAATLTWGVFKLWPSFKLTNLLPPGFNAVVAGRVFGAMLVRN
jgi:hypothetical protein